jgi:hypothetical protein
MRSMLPRNLASVRVRAPVMRRSRENVSASGSGREPEAGSFVHDMF